MLHDTYPVFFNFGDQVGIVHHRITTFFVILNNFVIVSRQRLVTVLSL